MDSPIVCPPSHCQQRRPSIRTRRSTAAPAGGGAVGRGAGGHWQRQRQRRCRPTAKGLSSITGGFVQNRASTPRWDPMWPNDKITAPPQRLCRAGPRERQTRARMGQKAGEMVLEWIQWDKGASSCLSWQSTDQFPHDQRHRTFLTLVAPPPLPWKGRARWKARIGGFERAGS
jgi:hypothetical protein